MSKAPNGQGSIQRVKSGRYKGKYRVAVVTGWTTDAAGKKKPLRKTGIFERWADADAFRKLELSRTGKADARRSGLSSP